jgi:hypothetical protein
VEREGRAVVPAAKKDSLIPKAMIYADEHAL